MVSLREVNAKSLVLLILAGILAFGVLAMTPAPSFASGHLLDPFTQTELDNDWEADRRFPSGGVTSVTAFGRDNVAQLAIDSNDPSTNSFEWYEGIKTKTDEKTNFGDAVQVDLYLDPEWANTAVNAGLWVVGDNGAGERDNYFAILEFVNNGQVPADFRIWDSSDGWSYLEADIIYDNWITLSISLDTDNNQYNYAIDGQHVGTAAGGENHIREVFLNSANYGARSDFGDLNNDSYAAHWHAGVNNPASNNDCKNGGWQDFGFNNQGQCIKFVNTGKDSR